MADYSSYREPFEWEARYSDTSTVSGGVWCLNCGSLVGRFAIPKHDKKCWEEK